MVSPEKTVRALIYFSVALGVVFLAQAYDILPPAVFGIIATGWALFVVDAALTFVSTRYSFYLAFLLAVLALGSSLPQGAHYSFIEAGEVLPSATFILGSLAQVLLIIFVPYYFYRRRAESTGSPS